MHAILIWWCIPKFEHLQRIGCVSVCYNFVLHSAHALIFSVLLMLHLKFATQAADQILTFPTQFQSLQLFLDLPVLHQCVSQAIPSTVYNFPY